MMPLDVFERKLSLLRDVAKDIRETSKKVNAIDVDVNISTNLNATFYIVLEREEVLLEKEVCFDLNFDRSSLRFWLKGTKYSYNKSFPLNGKVVSKIGDIVLRYAEKFNNDDGLEVVVEDLLEG